MGEEARAGDGVVDFGLGSRAGPVLQEGGRELGIQLGPRVVRQQLAGHVALLGLGVVVRQIHVPQRIGNLLIDFGPGVEIQQSRDDLGIDLAAVVVAGQGRGDGRGHRAAGGVVGQLARHVGRQGRGDEGLDLRLVLELGQVQGVDGGGDRCARFRLRVGLAAGREEGGGSRGREGGGREQGGGRSEEGGGRKGGGRKEEGGGGRRKEEEGGGGRRREEGGGEKGREGRRQEEEEGGGGRRRAEEGG